MVSHTSAGSRRVDTDCMTTVLPPVNPVKVAHWAAPCIRGGRASILPPPFLEASTISSSDSNTVVCPNGRPPMADMKMSC